MTVVDVVIIFIIVLSALFGLLRGFMRESISLAKWIIATWIAATFAPKLAPMLPAAIESEAVRQAISFATLFLIVFVLGTLVTHLVTRILIKTGLTSIDRVLGIGFGVLRGALIIVIFVIVASQFPQLPEEDWWQESAMLHRFENVVIWMQDYIPDMKASAERSVV
ncbi:MAG: CvpA family protein [Thiotrichales bacterium]|nr:MAG: CvpA family protein [Thiotrichales bacterium]